MAPSAARSAGLQPTAAVALVPARAEPERAARHPLMPLPHPTMGRTDMAPEPTPLVLTIEQAAQRLGIGRTLMYALVTSGEIESVTIGRLRRIPAECLTEYVDRLREQGAHLPTVAA